MIELENLYLGYDNKVIIKNISLIINDGDYIAVVGSNGSGKSTLIKGILNLIKPFKGNIKYRIKKNEIGYLPQINDDNSFFPASVYEIVLSGCLNKKGLIPFYCEKDKINVNWALKELHITNLKNKCYKELSAGQRQKVLLARALVAGNKILILDEPITGLDYKSTKDMYNIIDKLNKKGITIIMISHDIDTMIEHASHILYLENAGYKYGTVSKFFNHEEHICFGDKVC